MGILVAVSNDSSFKTVLTVAVRLASGLDQGLYVAHITEEKRASGEKRAFRDEVRAFLSDTDVPVDISLEHLERSGLRSGTAVGKQLTDLATDVDINHIVIGHRQKGRLAAVREGHTGFVVAEEAAVPVTIVPEAVEL